MAAKQTSRADRPNVIPWPPIVLVGSIAAGLAFARLVPLGWPRGPGADILQGVGVVLVVLAIALYVSTFMAFSRAKTTVLPTKGASHLVTGGPFRFTRNPIYLGNFILVAGLGLILANGWLVILAFVAAFAEQKLAIEREEAHLEHRFGRAWRDYAKRVRRWI